MVSSNTSEPGGMLASVIETTENWMDDDEHRERVESLMEEINKRKSEEYSTDPDGFGDFFSDVSKESALVEMETVLLVLVARRGRASGSELCEEAESLFGFDLAQSTMYPKLKGLVSDGMLEVAHFPQSKRHELTEHGEEELEQRREELASRYAVFSTFFSEVGTD